jgi:hypothetical protein
MVSPPAVSSTAHAVGVESALEQRARNSKASEILRVATDDGGRMPEQTHAQVEEATEHNKLNPAKSLPSLGPEMLSLLCTFQLLRATA